MNFVWLEYMFNVTFTPLVQALESTTECTTILQTKIIGTDEVNNYRHFQFGSELHETTEQMI